jgi:hypothetical protein
MSVRTEESLAAPATHEHFADGGQKPRNPWRSRAVWIGIAVLVAVVALGCVLASKWPFTREELIRSLEQDSQGKVEVGSVRETYFPHPGCVAENVVIRRDATSPELNIRRVTILGSYAGMLHRYIPRVIAEGAVLKIPVDGLKKLFTSDGNQQPTNTSIGEIDADDAQILVETEENDGPLAFRFQQLKLHDVSKDSKVRYLAALQNPEPTGDLKLQGQIGPFQREHPGNIPLSGSYTFENAKLEQFKGIGGVLSSEGKFSGQLKAIDVDGSTETPDFQLDVGIHPIDLRTKFHATVDGTNGDVRLEKVETSWGKTTVNWSGTIEGPEGAKDQKTVTLDLSSDSARVQDLLILFVHDEVSPMSGAISFSGHATVVPKPERFLEKLKVDGDFSIKEGKFSKHETQQNVEVLSARAQGHADRIEDDQERDKRKGSHTLESDLQPVTSNVKAKVALRDGIAHLSDVTFEVPGATALLTGTYALETKKIDGQGTAHMQAKLDKATTGVKSLVMKVVAPLKPGHGDKEYSVGVRITGTYGHPSFAVQPMKGGS